jgi:hypothetical protein
VSQRADVAASLSNRGVTVPGGTTRTDLPSASVNLPPLMGLRTVVGAPAGGQQVEIFDLLLASAGRFESMGSRKSALRTTTCDRRPGGPLILPSRGLVAALPAAPRQIHAEPSHDTTGRIAPAAPHPQRKCKRLAMSSHPEAHAIGSLCARKRSSTCRTNDGREHAERMSERPRIASCIAAVGPGADADRGGKGVIES